MAKQFQYFLDTVRPYQLIVCFCGVTTYPFFINSPPIRRVLSCIFLLYKGSLFSAAMFVAYERNKLITRNKCLENDSLTGGIKCAQFIPLTIIQIVMNLDVIFKYKQLKNIFLEILAIEQDLVQISRNTHSSRVIYAFKRQLICVSGLMLISVLSTPAINAYVYILEAFPFFHWIIHMFCEAAIRCKSVEFCLYLQIFNKLFSELLNCIDDVQRNFNSNTRHPFIEHILLQQKILQIKSVQSKIWKTINGFTDYFAISMLCHFLYNGLSVTNIIYWIYIKINQDGLFSNISRMFILILHLLDILMPCFFSDQCVKTYGQITRVIHDFKPTTTDILFKMCLREYSLQLTHQKLVFSCGGYFNINLQCFGDIILMVATYIVILIQFKLQAEKT